MNNPYTMILFRNPNNQLEIRSYSSLDTRFQTVLGETLTVGLTPLAYSEGDGQMQTIEIEQNFRFTHKPMSTTEVT